MIGANIIGWAWVVIALVSIYAGVETVISILIVAIANVWFAAAAVMAGGFK